VDLAQANKNCLEKKMRTFSSQKKKMRTFSSCLTFPHFFGKDFKVVPNTDKDIYHQ
jgi:hypothetical protein